MNDDDITTPFHPQSVRWIKLKSIKAMSVPLCGAGLYFLFSGDELVYIGQSKNASGRIGQHSTGRGKGSFDRYTFVPFDKPHLISKLEAHLINKFQPRLNRQGNPGVKENFGLNGLTSGEKKKIAAEEKKRQDEWHIELRRRIDATPDRRRKSA